MRKFLLLISAVVIFASQAWAQDRTVTGKVTSTEDGSPLPGVNVVLKGTTIGTATDADGKYSISVPGSGGSLVFSFIGLQTQEIVIGDRAVVDISLALDATQLNEIVVVGYGTQDKRTLTSSIAKVSGEDLALKPVPSFDVALQGRAAGVFVNQTSGLVGQAPRIRIRGVNSISSGTSPLVVVDGVPMQTGNISGVAQNNLLGDINPNDIESYEVLKDGAATAIYGSRAANGVILITTKSGKSGKPVVNYDVQYGFNTIARRYEVLNANQFIKIQNEKLATAGVITPQALPGPNNVDTDWQDVIFRTGVFQNHNLSISGGSQDFTYFFSGGYSDQEGAVVNNSLQRYSMTGKVDYSGVKWLNAGLKLQLTRQVNNNLNTGSNALSGNTPSALYAFPNVPVYDKNNPTGYNLSTDLAMLGRGNNLLDIASRYTNVQYTLDHNVQEADNYRILSQVYAQVNIMDGLSLRTQFGADIADGEDFLSWNPIHGDGGGSTRGIVYRGAARSLRYNWVNTLSYKKTFLQDHTVNVVAATDIQKETFRTFYGQGQTYNDPFFLKYDLISNTFLTQTSGGDYSQNAIRAYIGRVNYDYKGKYIASLSVRNDALSQLPEDNRAGTFLGGSVGWVVSEESFFNFDFISSLKVRASYAEVGNTSFSDFSYIGTYSGALYGGQSGQSFSQVGNSSLGWEVSVKSNIGFDASLMNNRFTVTFDYWKNDVKDLILDAPTPPTAGIPGNSISTNIGKIENSGIELAIGADILTSGPIRWHADFTLTTQKNKITQLANNNADVIGSYTINRVGESIGSIFGYVYKGVNPANGNPLYEKADGTIVQGNLDNNTYYVYDPSAPNEFTTSTTLNDADKKVLGTSLPKFFGGISNRFSYKAFDLEIFLTYSGGNQIMNVSRENLMHQDFKNNGIEILNRWTPENTNTDVPRLSYQNTNFVNFSGQGNSRFVEDGDYLRIQDITLGYSMPKATLASLTKGTLQKMRVFAQVRNLATFTKYKGPDPELNNGGQGVDALTNPLMRTYTFGLSIGF
jgi:TonB-linked SusC/RagA family outer membrane protein